ncbi:MAG: NAD(P)H-dependent oxidoreductase [Kiritimatiellae bacterium]|nr:NAD(P)H-dependent oxidoreductase [Kiritimatiellia bacterium]MDD5523192.1 NAD(P)H-dependent oxidoreductase [Kiritimatiellia bacterium]
MNVSLILAHPEKKSFNHAIAMTVVERLRCNGYRVKFHDLYAEKFDPILYEKEIPEFAKLPRVIKQYCREIRDADGIIIVHPNWWGQPPAILKGWIDRVIRAGVAYKFLDGDSGEGVPVGLLKARIAIVFNTSNTKRQREIKVFGDPLETLWKNCIFGLCGVRRFYRATFGVMVTSSPAQRGKWLRNVDRVVSKHFPRVG